MKQTPVADYFKDPAHHTKIYEARDGQGNPISTNSDEAVCRCIVGQVQFVYPARYEDRQPIYNAIAEVIRKRFPDRLGDADCCVSEATEFNDHPDTTPQEVYEVCVEAQV